MEMTRNQAIDRFYLTDEHIKQITKTIIQTLIYNKEPSDNPICIVVGGQSGAGKTALINLTTQISTKRQFVVIDNDFFRGFHPRADEIKRICPQYYTDVTDQLGLGITSEIIEYLKNNHYDIILHQTLKNTRIADDAMTKFKEEGYTVGLRAFAVPSLESKLSMVERCIGQLEKLHQYRAVKLIDHYNAYVGLPDTVKYIEENNKADFIEVFSRGEEIYAPRLVYASQNKETFKHTQEVTSNCEKLCLDDFTNGYANVKEAVVETRMQKENELIKTTLKQRFKDAKRLLQSFEMQGEDVEILFEQLDDIKRELKEIALLQKKTTLVNLEDEFSFIEK